MIKNRVGIESRPEIVERRIRIGDWEGDTVVGKNHQGALVALVDRKSKLTLIGKVGRYTAEAVEKTIVYLMELLPRRSYTLTVDNGKEFASHESVAKTLRIKVYFAEPTLAMY
jgi:IS30 family transposase